MSRPRIDGPARSRKRSVMIHGHRTNISLEEIYWTALRKLARDGGKPLAAVLADIDGRRVPGMGLSAAVRLDLTVLLRDRVETLSRLVTDALGPAGAAHAESGG